MTNPIRQRLMDGQWRHWRDPLQALDMATNSFLPGDWYNPVTRSFNNPLQAFGLDGLGRRIGNMFRPAGQPLPGWMQPNAPMPSEGPARIDVQMNYPGVQPQGRGPLMAYQSPPRSGVGAGNGRTIAQGQGARDMVEGMRDNSRNAQNQARNAMNNMFAGEER